MGTRISYVLLVLGVAGVARANTVVEAEDLNQPPVVQAGITNAVISGFDMAALGLTITVNFVGGGNSGPVAWTTCGIGCGQASGSIGDGSWTLTQSGNTGASTNALNPNNTAQNPWTLTSTATNVAIASVILNGGSSIVFDRDLHRSVLAPPESQQGTPGTGFGIDFTEKVIAPNEGWTVTATYSRILQFSGPAQACLGSTYVSLGKTTDTGCGDAWGALAFAFTAGPAFQNGAVWSFFQDTDAAVGVPEPLSMGLVGGGLIALAAYRKWRTTGVR